MKTMNLEDLKESIEDRFEDDQIKEIIIIEPDTEDMMGDVPAPRLKAKLEIDGVSHGVDIFETEEPDTYEALSEIFGKLEESVRETREE